MRVDGSYGNGWEEWEWMRKTREMRGEGWELWVLMGMDGSHADGWPCGLAAAMALLHTEQMLKGKEGQKNHPWDGCPLDGSIFCVESSGITPRPFFLRVFP